MSIDTTHGIVSDANSELFVHRNFVDTARFTGYLRSRVRPYVSLRSAIKGKGDALTIDDSTVAAADAARLARKMGHEVTLFINGYNIALAKPYFFSRLSVLLDAVKEVTVTYNGKRFDMSAWRDKERFRKVLKKQLAVISREESRDGFVTEIGRLLGQYEIELPTYLQVMSYTALKDLVSLGVDIQNHGWTHSRIGSMPPEAHAADIRRGREWLRAACGIDAEFYAVPNGDGLPFWKKSSEYRAWFLLDARWPDGEVLPGVYGRTTLTL
jgi:peptidoglycan/xylan/chitin deacetylase (PgdA/CDA1 family)